MSILRVPKQKIQVCSIHAVLNLVLGENYLIRRYKKRHATRDPFINEIKNFADKIDTMIDPSKDSHLTYVLKTFYKGIKDIV